MEGIFDLYSYLKISGSQAAKKRAEARRQGIHVPAFLQADIAEKCNLSCPGCYKQHVNIEFKERLLTIEEWDSLFREAEQLGIRFIFLSGGEPLMKREILRRAARYQNIWFLVITNGTLLDDSYYRFFSDNRNLIPVLCLEICSDVDLSQSGKSSYLYGSLMHSMDELRRRDIVYGASVALTKENRKRVVSRGFLDGLDRRKCNGVVFIDYGQENAGKRKLLLEPEEEEKVKEELRKLQKEYHDMVFYTFSGENQDPEKGILQKREIFRVTTDGFVYSDLYRENAGGNLKNLSFREILKENVFSGK